MAKTKVYTRRTQIIADFLPNARFNRITLETPRVDSLPSPRGPAPNPGITFDEDTMSLFIDLEIDNVIDDAAARLARGDVLAKESGDIGQPDKDEIQSKFDEALKVCVLVGTTPLADNVLKRVLIRSGGSFQERVRSYKGINNITNSHTIKQALQSLVASVPGEIHLKTAIARPVDGQQSLDSSIEHMRTFDSKGNAVFRMPISFDVQGIPANPDTLCVYAFTFVDFDVFDIEIPPDELAWLNSLYGRMVYKKVIENGQTAAFSMQLLEENGTPWTGTYHQMESGGGYMTGRNHSDRSRPLTQIMVPNLKVQDFRAFKRSEKDLYIPHGMPSFLQADMKTKFLKDKRDNHFNSRLEIEHDPVRGNVEFEFVIDQEQILRQNSRFGSIYDKLPNGTRYNVLRPRDYFRLVNVKVLRRRVTERNLGINSLGLPAKDVFDREAPLTVVAETGEPHRIGSHPRASVNTSEFEIQRRLEKVFDEGDLLIRNDTNTSSISDEPYSELAESTNSDSFVEWLSEQVSTPVPLDGLKTLPFPFYRNIIGSDLGLMSVHDGVYQYGIELTYEDGIEKYLTEIMQNLQRETTKLEEYYNECVIPVTSVGYPTRSGLSSPTAQEINPDYRSRRIQKTDSQGNYNHIRKAFSPDFISYANTKYDFRKMVSAYFDVVNVVHADAQLRVGSTSIVDEEAEPRFDFDTVMSLLMPNNSRPEQVLEILGSFQEMARLLSDITDTDLIKNAANVSLVRGDRSSSGRTPTMITVQKWYSDVDDYVDATAREEPSFDFLGENMLMLTLPTFTTVASVESTAVEPTSLQLPSLFSPSPDTTPKATSPRKQHGQKSFTPAQVAERVATEMAKFDTDFGETKYDNSPASLTFMSFNIPGPSPIKISFAPEGKEVFGSPEVKEDLIIRYRSQRSRRNRRKARTQFSRRIEPFKVMDMVLRRSKTLKKKSLGRVRPLVLGKPTSKFTKRKGRLKKPNISIMEAMKKTLETELVSQAGHAIFVRAPKKILKKLATVDSIKSLCNETANEPRPLIDFELDLSEETSHENEITDKSIAVAETIRKTAESKIEKKKMIKKVAISKIRETIEFSPPAEVRKLPTRRRRRTRRDAPKKKNPPATAAGWARGAAAAKQKKEEIKTFPDPTPVLVKKKTLDPPMQVLKLAEPGPSLGATESSAPSSLYGSVMKIQKLDDFKRDDSNRPILSAPIYKEVTVAEVKQGLPEGKYKLESFESVEMDITPAVVSVMKPVRFKITKESKPPVQPAKKPEPKSVIATAIKEQKKKERTERNRSPETGKVRNTKVQKSSRIIAKEEQKESARKIREAKNRRQDAPKKPKSNSRAEAKAAAKKDAHRRAMAKKEAAKQAAQRKNAKRQAADRRRAEKVEAYKNAKANRKGRGKSKTKQSKPINIVKGSVSAARLPISPMGGGSMGGFGGGGFGGGGGY